MMNVINSALAEASKAALQQCERLLNELNSAGECMAAAKSVFERDMTEVRKLREAADKKQAEAVRDFDAHLIQLNAVIVTLKRQISDGEIVSGIMGETVKELPPVAQPKVEAANAPH